MKEKGRKGRKQREKKRPWYSILCAVEEMSIII